MVDTSQKGRPVQGQSSRHVVGWLTSTSMTQIRRPMGHHSVLSECLGSKDVDQTPDQTLWCAGHPEATRIAVDLPQDFCGAASLALRFPDSITAADNGAGMAHTLNAPVLFLVSPLMNTSLAFGVKAAEDSDSNHSLPDSFWRHIKLKMLGGQHWLQVSVLMAAAAW